MVKDLALTLPGVAKLLGIHRSTLVRLEQRGHVPEAKWHPVLKVRIYLKEDIDKVQKAYETYVSGRVMRGEGRVVVDPGTLVQRKDV